MGVLRALGAEAAPRSSPFPDIMDQDEMELRSGSVAADADSRTTGFGADSEPIFSDSFSLRCFSRRS